MTKIYFTADTHFDHENIIGHCNRPFKNVGQMNHALISNWNKVVQKKDIVFFLGDLSFNNDDEFLKKLNGNIIHIKGNHDHGTTIIKEVLIKYGGKEWLLIHDSGIFYENKMKYCDIRYVLCGHVHEKWKHKRIKDKICVNVGVDVWNFKPITIQDILTEIGGYNGNGRTTS